MGSLPYRREVPGASAVPGACPRPVPSSRKQDFAKSAGAVPGSQLGACCKLVLRHESMMAPRFQEPASPGRGPSRPESGLKCPRTAAGSGLSASRLGRFAWHRPRFGAESGGAASCHVVRWSLAGSCGVTVIRGQPGPCWAGGLWKNPISERSWLLAACGWPRL